MKFKIWKLHDGKRGKRRFHQALTSSNLSYASQVAIKMKNDSKGLSRGNKISLYIEVEMFTDCDGCF